MISSRRKKTNRKSALKHIILINLIFLLSVLLFDYFDSFSFISRKLNFDFLSIFVNVLVIITMFFVTYNVVEKRTFEINLERKYNKSNVLYTLILRTYDNCILTLSLVNNQELFKKYFIPKCDFDAPSDPFLQIQLKMPFEFDSEIINLMEDGIADRQVLVNYLEIKALFRKYVQQRVTFFDIDSYKNNKSKEISILINNDKINLEKKINDEIKSIIYKIEEKQIC